MDQEKLADVDKVQVKAKIHLVLQIGALVGNRIKSVMVVVVCNATMYDRYVVYLKIQGEDERTSIWYSEELKT